MNNEYKKVGLYEHNARSYQKVKEAFQKEDIVGIVHATGTGKTFNALQLAYDNQDKEIVYVVPSNGIIEHIEKVITENPNLDSDRDFSNLHFRTYQSFVSLSIEEIASIPCDLLILDEFHHIGAPIWENRINTMKETHPNMKIFGMTAYTIRSRGTIDERDMASPDGNELFSNAIVSTYDLCDAMIDGVLPKPIYISAYVHLLDTVQELERRVEKLNPNIAVYPQYRKILASIKRKIQEAPSIPELLEISIKPNGKYIYFCPPLTEEGANDMETIKKQALEWFKRFVPEENIIFYTSTSEMGLEGKKNRKLFYDDQTFDGKSADGKLRVMFAINQYNEGIHAPNIDGVIMGRATSSDIVFFEQLGRALVVKGDVKGKFEELDKYSRKELMEMCLKKNIFIREDTFKEEIIQKLLAPIIIDLTNNIDFIRELEGKLYDRMQSILETKHGYSERGPMKISDASFDITMQNEDLFEELRNMRDKLINTWEANYELAQAYYEHHKNLNIPKRFKTINGYGYDENGIALGSWIQLQRGAYKGMNKLNLSKERMEKLESIGMVWSIGAIRLPWEKIYELAKNYYEYHGNLLIPGFFRTQNGHEYDENGIKIGSWIISQRIAYKEWKNEKEERKRKHKISVQQIEQLSSIGMVWEDTKEIVNNQIWEKYYVLAKIYYEVNHHLLIPALFRTIDGFTEIKKGESGYDKAINLGGWLQEQRRAYKEDSSSYRLDRIKKLESIGMVWSVGPKKIPWEEIYHLAKVYYESKHHLMIPGSFKTKNGYEYDESGVALGRWIMTQRQVYNGICKGKLSAEQIYKLTSIGMVWDVRKNKQEISDFCNSNGIDFDRNKEILTNISLCELQLKTSFLEEKGEKVVDENGCIHNIFTMSSFHIMETYGITLEELYEHYYVKKKGAEK